MQRIIFFHITTSVFFKDFLLLFWQLSFLVLKRHFNTVCCPNPHFSCNTFIKCISIHSCGAENYTLIVFFVHRNADCRMTFYRYLLFQVAD